MKSYLNTTRFFCDSFLWRIICFSMSKVFFPYFFLFLMSICVVLSEVIGTLKEASILSLTPPKHTDRIKSPESEDRVHQTRKYHPNDPGKINRQSRNNLSVSIGVHRW